MAKPTLNVFKKRKPPEAASPKEEENLERKGFKFPAIPLWAYLLAGAQVILFGGGLLVFQYISSQKQKELQEKKTAVKKKDPDLIGLSPHEIAALKVRPLHYDFDPLAVNISSEEGDLRLLEVTISFEMESQPAMHEMRSRAPQIRDELTILLSGKNADDFQKPESIPNLQKEILTRLNRILTSGTVKQVFFTDFMIE